MIWLARKFARLSPFALIAAVPSFVVGQDALVGVVNVHIEYLQESTDWCPPSEGAMMSIEMDGPEVGIWSGEIIAGSGVIKTRRGNEAGELRLPGSYPLSFDIEHMGRFKTSLNGCESLGFLELRGQWQVISNGETILEGSVARGPELNFDAEVEEMDLAPKRKAFMLRVAHSLQTGYDFAGTSYQDVTTLTKRPVLFGGRLFNSSDEPMQAKLGDHTLAAIEPYKMKVTLGKASIPLRD